MNKKEKQTSKAKIKALDGLFAKILRDSNEEDRKELKKVLWRWKTKTLLVSALQEQKDIQDREENEFNSIISELIKIGKKGKFQKMEIEISHSRFWHLGTGNDLKRIRALPIKDILCLIKGVAIAERNLYPGWGSGSATPVSPVYKILKRMLSKKNIEILIHHLLKDRKNPYIPFGWDVPIEITSLDKYLEYEAGREKHKQEVIARQQEEQQKAKQRKQKRQE